MSGVPEAPPGQIALLFTQFPVDTETFLQREVEALKALGLPFTVIALWPRRKGDEGAPCPDETFHPLDLIGLLWWIPFWLVRRPEAMGQLAASLVQYRVSNLVNLAETLLGLAYGICRAHRIGKRYTHLHAVWASAPATAAWALFQLTGRTYSMAGHAYDLFENGGDGLLPRKIPAAHFIRTSSEAGRMRWIQLGALPGQVRVIRRGLPALPAFVPDKPLGEPVEIVTVGRFVEKMGYDQVVRVLAAFKMGGIDFRATFIGDGPLRKDISRLAENSGLAGQVAFAGAVDYRIVEAFYARADLLLFGGKVSSSGDRAGFPNVIAEAMAWGLVVFATPVGAVLEGIHDGDSGFIFSSPGEAREKLLQLLIHPEKVQSVRLAARKWVETHFDVGRNMQELAHLLEAEAALREHRQIHCATAEN